MHILKRLLNIFLILVIAVSTFMDTADAQGDKYSYRLRGFGQGLYGLVDDLYSDISFNPSFIRRYQGTTLYTNISNMQGKSDQSQFNQEEVGLTMMRSTDLFPSNLLGVVTDRFGLPMGFFWESQGYNITLENESSNTDYTSLTAGSFTGNSLDLGADFSGHSLSWIGMIRDFGVSVSYHKLGFDLNVNEEDVNQIFSGVDSLGNRSNSESVTVSNQRNFKFPNSMIAFSIGKVIKKEDSEFSISAGRRPEKVSFNANDIFGMFKEPFFGGGENKLSKLSEKDMGFMEIGLKTYFLNIRMKKIKSSINSLQQNSLLFKYERYGLPISIDAVQETIHDSLAVVGASRKTIKTDKYSISQGSGDGILNNIELGIGTERHLNNFQTMIALGAKVNYIWGNLDFAFAPGRLKETYEVDVQIGDPAEEINSYTRIISDNREEITTGSVKGVFLSVPLGFETKITKKLTLRMGARSIIPLSFDTEWETETNDGVDELVETDEETSAYTPPVAFPSADLKKFNITGKSLNLDSYHFGARYELNEFISIDLLHFAKVTELDTWWLSVELKY